MAFKLLVESAAGHIKCIYEYMREDQEHIPVATMVWLGNARERADLISGVKILTVEYKSNHWGDRMAREDVVDCIKMNWQFWEQEENKESYQIISRPYRSWWAGIKSYLVQQ